MPIIRIVILMLLLFFGAYATHVAEKEVKRDRSAKVRMDQLKKDLSERDYAFMQMALNVCKLARANDHTNTSGSLIIKNGKVIGSGWDQSNSLTDPTAHSVMQSVKEACNNLGATSLEGCVIYSSTQPCPMCLSLLYLTNVSKIIYMGSDTKDVTDDQLLNRQVYGSLLKDPTVRTIPEVVLFPADLNRSF